MDSPSLDNSSMKKTSKRSLSSQNDVPPSNKRKKSLSKSQLDPVTNQVVPFMSNKECKEITIQTREGLTSHPHEMNSKQRITHVSLCCDSGSNCMHLTFRKEGDNVSLNVIHNGELDNTMVPKTTTTTDTVGQVPQEVLSHDIDPPRQGINEAGSRKLVQVEEQTFFVDPETFTEGSEFFKMAWKGSGLYMKEKDGPLVLEETSVSFFRHMEEFFATGKIQLLEQSCTIENVMEILEGATQYLCPKLTIYCTTILLKELEAHPPSKAAFQPLLEFAEFNQTFAEHLRTFLHKRENKSLEYEPALAFKLFQTCPQPTREEQPADFIKRVIEFLKICRKIDRLAVYFADESESIFRKDFNLMEALMANSTLPNKRRLQLLLHWKQQQLITEPQFDHLVEKHIKLHAIAVQDIPEAMVTRYGLDKPINVQYYAQWAAMTFGEVPSVCSGRHKVRTILTSWLWHVISEDKRFGTQIHRYRLFFETVCLFDQFLLQKSKHLLGRQSVTLSKLQLIGLGCLQFVCMRLGILLPIPDCEAYTDRAYSATEFLDNFREIEETYFAHKFDVTQNPLECSGMLVPFQLPGPEYRPCQSSPSSPNNITNNNNEPSNNIPSNDNNSKSPELAEATLNINLVVGLWAIHLMSWGSSHRSAGSLGIAGAKAISILRIPDVEVMAVQLRDLLNLFAMEQKYCLLELLEFMKMRTPDFAHVTRDFEEYEEFSVFWKSFGGFLKLKKNTVFTFYHNSEQKSPVLSIQI